MDRVLILGCCGSGKSTLSYQVRDILGHELIHLDQHYWKSGWIEPPIAEWENTVDNLISRERWIMDGNYSGTLNQRMDRADSVVYIDSSTVTCLYRVIKRILRYRGTTRPDMTAGCPERFDLNFLHYVASFNFRKRKSMLSKLRQVSSTKKVFILKSDKDKFDFLHQLQSI